MKLFPVSPSETNDMPEPSAAVAIIRCRKPCDSILLLRRNKRDDDPWSGHFAFPGGRKEEYDSDIFSTCQRETREETGILLGTGDLTKQLPVTPAGRRFRNPVQVQPFVFELDLRPSVTVELSEISSYHWLDISSFRDQDKHVFKEVYSTKLFPVFPLEDYFLWGFTYGLLCSILNVKAAMPPR